MFGSILKAGIAASEEFFAEFLGSEIERLVVPTIGPYYSD